MTDVEIVARALAEQFHEIYERLAPSFGYETRKETQQFDPSTPNGRLMIAVCGEMARERAAALAAATPLIEARATAAIVADLKRLRRHEAYYGICFELDNLADRYERGKHLKGTSNE